MDSNTEYSPGQIQEHVNAPKPSDTVPLRFFDSVDYTGNAIRWFGIQTENDALVTGAAVFDIPVVSKVTPYLNTFDYVDLSPFGAPRIPTSPTNIPLDNLSQAENINGSSTFQLGLARITGEGDFEKHNPLKVLTIIKEGAAQGKMPLIIHGHGETIEETWRIGFDKQTASVGIADLLGSMGSLLSTVNPQIPTNLADRYSVVLLDSCNKEGTKIDQIIIDQIGVPTVYTTDIAAIGTTKPESMILAHPITTI